MQAATVVLISTTLLAAVADAVFNLTVLHTNDVHARFEQFDEYGGACSDQESADGECYGGVARRVSKIRQIRAEEKNVVLLDGGDQFQGTMWFYHYKGRATAHFMNIVGYDVMALGNHEFDNGPEGVEQFLRDVNATVVSSNIDASKETSIDGLFAKSTVLTVGEEKIGVIGYTYSRTPEISTTGDLVFSDEIEAIQAEVDRLSSEENINKMVALGHSGFDVDLEIAKRVEGIDLVVGGHTNTFLYTGTPPSLEVPVGPYPTVVRPDDDPVLVVQDYTFAKYLGRLDVTFNDEGKVTAWGGNPILLDKDVTQDPVALEEIEEWAESVRNFSSEYAGTSHVLLDGSCRLRECNLGNFIADAYLREEVKFPDELRWNDVSMVIVNGGSIRTSLPQGDLTIGDITNVLPFGNTVDTITIKGVYLMEALEHAVGEYDPITPPGKFLQFSGMIVSYDLSKPPGSRVAKVEVRCTECDVPEFVPFEMEKVYKVVIPSFVVSGGDGYTMIRDNVIEHNYGKTDASVAADYVKAMSPLTPGLERRIIFLEPSVDPCPISGSSSTDRRSMLVWLLLSVFMSSFLTSPRHLLG